MLSDSEDDNISMEEGQVSEDNIKVAPIIVDNCHQFTDIIKILRSYSKYKRMSIGTKVMPNTIADYEETIKNCKTNDE